MSEQRSHRPTALTQKEERSLQGRRAGDTASPRSHCGSHTDKEEQGRKDLGRGQSLRPRPSSDKVSNRRIPKPSCPLEENCMGRNARLGEAWGRCPGAGALGLEAGCGRGCLGSTMRVGGSRVGSAVPPPGGELLCVPVSHCTFPSAWISRKAPVV